MGQQGGLQLATRCRIGGRGPFEKTVRSILRGGTFQSFPRKIQLADETALAFFAAREIRDGRSRLVSTDEFRLVLNFGSDLEKFSRGLEVVIFSDGDKLGHLLKSALAFLALTNHAMAALRAGENYPGDLRLGEGLHDIRR